MDDVISRLSDIRSQYNCFNESEEPYYRALSEAIKMLSEQADGDTISRQAALDWLKNEWNGMVTSLFDGIKALPSAQPEKRTEERTETHECDYISRQDAIDYCYQLINVEHLQGSDEMNYGQERVNQTETILHHLELMPSAQPQRKTERWIDDGSELGCACPKCGASLDEYISNLNEYNHLIKYPKFCPNCGAKMEVEQPEHKCDTCKHEKSLWFNRCADCSDYELWEDKE